MEDSFGSESSHLRMDYYPHPWSWDIDLEVEEREDRGYHPRVGLFTLPFYWLSCGYPYKN